MEIASAWGQPPKVYIWYIYHNSLLTPLHPSGSLHIYDCGGVSWSALLSDARCHWDAVSRVISIGQTHWPDIASRIFVINAPFAVHYLWKLISLLLNEQTKAKVSRSIGFPDLILTLPSR